MRVRRLKRIDEKLALMVLERLKTLRHERGYTQEYVIDKTGLGISRFETELSVPTVMSISILCEFYQIRLDEFFAPLNYPPKG